MPNLKCRCGYVHNLSPIPDDGYVTVKDDQYDRLFENELIRKKFSEAKPRSKEFETLLNADAVVTDVLGKMYECPECKRLMWQKPDSDYFEVYTKEYPS